MSAYGAEVLWRPRLAGSAIVPEPVMHLHGRLRFSERRQSCRVEPTKMATGVSPLRITLSHCRPACVIRKGE